MQKLYIESVSENQIIDITSIINDLLHKNLHQNGLVHLYVMHTTCALTTAEVEEGSNEDYVAALTNLVPKLNFKHPHDPGHFPDHVLSSIIGTSLTIPVQSSSLDLGVYQKVVLIELNGPRKRQLVVNFLESQ